MIRTAVRKLRSHYHSARLRSLGQQPTWVRVAGGFEMFIDPSDDLDREFYLGTFEPAMRELITRTVRDGDTCVDIGAQKGYVSLTLAKAVGSRGRVLAFEPDKRAAAKLIANINRADQTVIEVFDSALGEQEGSCTFVLSKVLGWSSRFPNELAKTAVEETVEVRVNSLDEMVACKEVYIDASKLSFIKLDAEGSEPLILKGMKGLLSEAKPVLFMEVNYDSLAAAGSSPQDLQVILNNLQLDIYQPEYHSYFRSLRLRPVTDLNSLRVNHPNLTNIVAFRRPKDIDNQDGVARLISRRVRSDHG
jgi:FkbM family methyltransferase